MTIEQTIKKAMDGGYDARSVKLKFKERFFLDPSFWLGLGNALEWNMTDKFDDGKQTCWSHYPEVFAVNMDVWENSPAMHWHRFIDHLADGKTAEEFFANLNQRSKSGATYIQSIFEGRTENLVETPHFFLEMGFFSLPNDFGLAQRKEFNEELSLERECRKSFSGYASTTEVSPKFLIASVCQ